jgi:hypothetical protein
MRGSTKIALLLLAAGCRGETTESVGELSPGLPTTAPDCPPDGDYLLRIEGSVSEREVELERRGDAAAGVIVTVGQSGSFRPLSTAEGLLENLSWASSGDGEETEIAEGSLVLPDEGGETTRVCVEAGDVFVSVATEQRLLFAVSRVSEGEDCEGRESDAALYGCWTSGW